ncbi:MAG: immunity 26/phosphotriesterase HocA family protein [Caldilineaceae bacterium]
MKVRFKEGQWFAVPLDKGGYAVGIVARGHSRSVICLGYFFGDRFDSIPTEKDIDHLNAENAILVTRFGNPGLTSGHWPLISVGFAFIREEWPVPRFGRVDIIEKEWGWLVEYPDSDKWNNNPISETRVPVNELVGLPRDSLFDSRAVEIKLDDKLHEK